MQAVWKFPLKCDDKSTIQMPNNAKVLCVQAQHDEPQIWAICDTGSNVGKVERTFIIYGTGHQHESIEGDYIGTFQLHNGTFVFHVFEV